MLGKVATLTLGIGAAGLGLIGLGIAIKSERLTLAGQKMLR